MGQALELQQQCWRHLVQGKTVLAWTDSLYSGGIPRLLQAQIACLMSTEHDEINVHVVAVQNQVIAINFIQVWYWLIIDKAPNTGREYKIRDF